VSSSPIKGSCCQACVRTQSKAAVISLCKKH